MATGRARSASQAAGGPSLTRSTSLQLRNFALADPDLSAQCLAWGTAATTPATYGDLSNSHHLTLDGTNFSYNADGLIIMDCHVDGANVGGTVGDHLWLAYIPTTGSPISGTALTEVIDCGEIIA